MTETDKTRTPLPMPEKFLPYMDKYRVYKLFHDVLTDVILNRPRDHVKFMKIYMNRNRNTNKLSDRIIVLKSPEINIDMPKLVKELVRDLDYFVITRRIVVDRYEKHDDYVPGCMSADLLAEVAKELTYKEPVALGGWIMFDHPCTVDEARYLQMAGVLPTVTLNLCKAPKDEDPEKDPHTAGRSFFTQDYDGLKYAYKATLKDVYIEADEDVYVVAYKCFNAVRACTGGAQGIHQGFHTLGAPGTYRVLIIGPPGSGRKTQADLTSKHFGLVNVNFEDIFREAMLKQDELGEKLRKLGCSLHVKGEVVLRRLLQKDCVELGYVLTEFPSSAEEFEILEKFEILPNRVIFLTLPMETCRKRLLSRGVDWCTGKTVDLSTGGPRVRRHPQDYEKEIDQLLDQYYTDTLSELRGAAGITAVEVDAERSLEDIQVTIQTVIMSNLELDIEFCSLHQKSASQ